MQTAKPLNIFYEEPPDGDRWIPLDRYPRRIARRLLRGEPRAGGQQMVFTNLVRGLEELGVCYRINDFSYIDKHPEELACIIGKPHLINRRKWENPILFGSAVFAHPTDCPQLFEDYSVKKVLVPGKWMQKMFENYYGESVVSWPVGIDTDLWKPSSSEKTTDILIYDKKRWDHKSFEQEFINPIRNLLDQKRLSFEEIRYGHYGPKELLEKLSRCKAAIFLCESETQGLAYQQILSTGVPIMAWDRQWYWYCPGYNMREIKSEVVSSVPYWSDSCGLTFKDIAEFELLFDDFREKVRIGVFDPRSYILENLTLKLCAKRYLEIVSSIV